MKHVVCYSGGHSSALVAIEVTRRFGPENVILVNHDINPSVEDPDVKRFKAEVADYLGIPITFVNMKTWKTEDQFDVVIRKKAFKVGNGSALCTHYMKTLPFMSWLEKQFPLGEGCILYYGFDAVEKKRITRREQILGQDGYRTDFPLARWERTILSANEIGITPPLTYGTWKHANCIGCLKAGKQHWYAVYCLRPDLWAKAQQAEELIGYTILHAEALEDVEPMFKRMKAFGIDPSELVHPNKFWADARAAGLYDQDEDHIPCDCVT